MKKITAKMVLAKKSCPGHEEQIKKYFKMGRTIPQCLKLLDVAEIPTDDKIWAATRFMPDAMNRKFAIWCARQCKTECKEIREYINVIERYYNGKATQDELNTAYWAANSAAYWAVFRAANSAANWAAYRAANRAANDAAYCAAYRAAYRAACWTAARKEQIAKIKELIEMAGE